MTKSTSSVSARDIPKMVDVQDTSGIQPIETISEDTSGAYTVWTLLDTSGKRWTVTLPGDGRISYGRGPSRDGAEVRFYRNQTTKFYDAVVPNVLTIARERVMIERAPKTAEEVAAEVEKETYLTKVGKKREKEMLEEISSMIVRRDYAEGVDDF